MGIYDEEIPPEDIIGDNYPDFNVIHLKLLMNRERGELIKKLLLEGEPTICEEDILNMKIDLHLYNKSCTKMKIKRIYKNDKK